MMKRKGVEMGEDLEKMPDLPMASRVVQRLKDASERAHQRHVKIFNKWRNGRNGKNI